MMQHILLDILTLHSPSGKESAVSDYIQKFLFDLGVSSMRDDLGNIFASFQGAGTPLLLTAHLDTVTNSILPEPKIENDLIFSANGSILGLDDKATVAILLSVIKQMPQKPGRAFECLFTVQEENGCNGAKFVANNNIFPIQSKTGMSFDLPFPLGTILSGAAGIWRGKISFTGLSGHSARPEKCKNSLFAFTLFSEWFLKQNELPDVRANIGYIIGGKSDSFNVVPDHVEAEIELRAKSDLDEIFYAMQKYFLVIEEKTGVSIKIEKEYIKIPSYFHAPDDAWIKKLENSFSFQRIEARYEPFSFGGSDANIFQGKGINVAVLGNGVVDTHSPKERVLISDLQKVENFLLSFLAS